MDLRVYGVRNVIELAPMLLAMHRMTGGKGTVHHDIDWCDAAFLIIDGPEIFPQICSIVSSRKIRGLRVSLGASRARAKRLPS